ncbi:MAG TPA: NapC/NirT family cytochrome c [Polyangia bacterium]
MAGTGAFVALLIALGATALVFFGAGQLLATKWGRRALLLGAAGLPIAATAGAFKTGVDESSRTRFCLSCHEMERYGRSLFADNRKALPAVHFQDRLIDREHACYTCHTDYALFGDVKAKLNGLKHVYVHYLGKVPEKMALYQPYQNHNCLHCHDDARGYLEAPPHQAVSAQIASGALSCLKCHAAGHDLAAVDARHFWQAK